MSSRTRSWTREPTLMALSRERKPMVCHPSPGCRVDEPGGLLVEGIEGLRRPQVAERGINDDRHWRGLATATAKLAITYGGGAVLRAITLRLNG